MRLKDAAPELLKIVPSLVEPIISHVSNMEELELFGCLNAVVKLEDAAPEILKILPGIATRIQGKVAVIGCDGLKAIKENLKGSESCAILYSFPARTQSEALRFSSMPFVFLRNI